MSKLHDLAGERKEQLLQTCDKKGFVTGTATREECHKDRGRTHLAFMANLIDAKGNLILAQRNKGKSLWGGFWDSAVVSHILKGETALEAAQRRAKEEMGVEAGFTKTGAFYYFAKHNNYAENEYCYVLVSRIKGEPVPNPVEISAVRKITQQDLVLDIAQNPEKYTPWFLKGWKLYGSKMFSPD